MKQRGGPMDSVQQESNIAGTFTLKKRSKWFDFALVLWVLGLAGLLTLSELWLGVHPSEIGLGKCFLIFFACLIPVVVIHEGLHGLFFLLFGSKVKFGFQLTRIGPAAFTIPYKALPRGKFQVVALAPQIFTLFLFVALFQYSSPIILYALIASIVCNLGGGFLDFYVIYWLSKFPKNYLVKDAKDGGVVYKC